MSSPMYVNPLGDVIDISYNNVGNLRKNNLTTDARVDDAKKKNKSTYMQLSIWSLLLSLIVLIVIMLLRNI